MSTQLSVAVRIFRWATVSLFITVSASATTFRLYQDGYAEGAFVTALFRGEDLNSDGLLLYHVDLGDGTISGEVTSLSLSFSGNSLMIPFTIGLSEINILSYELGSGALGDVISEGIEAVLPVYYYATGYGPLGDEGPGGFVGMSAGGGDHTHNVARVTIVGDGGSSMTLLAMSLGSLLFGSVVAQRKRL